MSVTSVECRYPISIHLHLHRQTYRNLPPLAILITNTWLSCQVTLRTFQSSRPMGMLTLPNKKDSTERNWWMFQPITCSWLDGNLRCFFPTQQRYGQNLTLSSNGFLVTFTFQCCSGYLRQLTFHLGQVNPTSKKKLPRDLAEQSSRTYLLMLSWRWSGNVILDLMLIVLWIFCCWSEDIWQIMETQLATKRFSWGGVPTNSPSVVHYRLLGFTGLVASISGRLRPLRLRNTICWQDCQAL